MKRCFTANFLTIGLLFFINGNSFAQLQTITFSYTGAPQTYTVPAGTSTITVDMSGATGVGAEGDNSDDLGAGGAGGRVQGTLSVTPGEVLTLYVGGSWSGNSISGWSDNTGYNGGGTGGAQDDNVYNDGGGASDIRAGGSYTANRVMVAGGGGGAGGNHGNGGMGGDSIGGVAPSNSEDTPAAQGGTQLAGGKGAGGFLSYQVLSYAPSGSWFYGGSAVYFGTPSGGGGGGGGYYGGGAGFDGGGGGGSSYADPGTVSNLVMTQGYNTVGNGYIKITGPPLGIAHVVTEIEGVSLFPNPASRYACLQFSLQEASNAQLEVYDAVGRIVYHTSPVRMNPGNQKYIIPTENLAGGIYSIKILTDNGIATQCLSVVK